MKIEAPIAPGHVYGCHTDSTGHGRRRGGTNTAYMNKSVDRRLRDNRMKPQYIDQEIALVTTDWAPIACGHSLRISDPSCTGCANRERDE